MMIVSPNTMNTIGKAMNTSMVLGAGAGAGIGGAYGAVSQDMSSAKDGALIGSMTGAAVGAAAIPIAGAIGTVAVKTIGAIGEAGISGIKNLDKVGSAAFSVARGVGTLGGGLLDSLNSTSKLMNPIGHYANVAQKVVGKLVTHEPAETFWNAKKQTMDTKGGGLKLSGWGKMAVGVSAVAQGVFGAKKAFEESRMGTQDTSIMTATPTIPSYANNGGASGDLVFALNANRRG